MKALGKRDLEGRANGRSGGDPIVLDKWRDPGRDAADLRMSNRDCAKSDTTENTEHKRGHGSNTVQKNR